MTRPTLLFVCTHNAGRSALGAALDRRRASDQATVLSAGMAPADQPSDARLRASLKLASTTPTTSPVR